jgi:hypothetical protein
MIKNPILSKIVLRLADLDLKSAVLGGLSIRTQALGARSEYMTAFHQCSSATRTQASSRFL